MDAKKLITNKSLCVLPWTGFELEPNGTVKSCIMSNGRIGDIALSNIKDIMHGEENVKLKRAMLNDELPSACSGCHLQEKNRNDLSSISSRLYYLKELGKTIDLNMLDDVDAFKLKHIDLRWTNSCNQACVYCGPELSSKWAQELGVKVKSPQTAKQEVKNFVFDNITQLENVYLAGGEPMLMKENYELLERLLKDNPECSVRVNTNLSTTRTGIFELLCKFRNVHWTVSVESMEHEYNYIRHHGSWEDFIMNLKTIRNLDHKISFNMLHLIFNHMSIFQCIDYFSANGFHDNSFIIGPLYGPRHLNILNLPNDMIGKILGELRARLSSAPQGYLKNSYENLIAYYTDTPWKKDLQAFHDKITEQDKRRGVDARKVFPDLYQELDAYTLE